MARSIAGCALALLLIGAATPLTAQEWRTISGQRRVAGESNLKVEVQFGAGQLQLEPASSGTLYRTSLRYDAEIFNPIHEYSPGALRIGVEGLNNRIRGDIRDGGRLNLSLTQDVPMDLQLKFGAVEAEMELGGMRLRRVRITTGASESRLNFSKPNPIRMEELEIEAGAADLKVYGLGNANVESLSVTGGVGAITLDFTGRWYGDTNASIDLGLGTLTLKVPRGVGVQVRKDSFLMGFESDGMIKRGNAYYSRDWDSAKRKLTVRISGAFGSVDIDWVDSNDDN